MKKKETEKPIEEEIVQETAEQ
ncbi:MAG: hypothetical protein RL127_1035, partial [Bacteroidota bacterium]